MWVSSTKIYFWAINIKCTFYETLLLMILSPLPSGSTTWLFANFASTKIAWWFCGADSWRMADTCSFLHLPVSALVPDHFSMPKSDHHSQKATPQNQPQAEDGGRQGDQHYRYRGTGREENGILSLLEIVKGEYLNNGYLNLVNTILLTVHQCFIFFCDCVFFSFLIVMVVTTTTTKQLGIM